MHIAMHLLAFSFTLLISAFITKGPEYKTVLNFKKLFKTMRYYAFLSDESLFT